MPRFLVVPVLFAVACASENELAGVTAEPELELHDPAEAAWMADGAVDVRGTARGLRQITVQGKAVQVEDGAFSGRVVLDRGVNVVEAGGVDANGDARFVRHGVLAGEFADPGAPVEGAVAIRVNQGGLDAMLDHAGAMITSEAIAEDLADANPVYEDHYDVWGWEAADVYADISDLSFDSPALRATPESGVLTLDVSLPNLVVEVTAYGEVVGMDFDTQVWLFADDAQIAADLTVDAEDGKLVADLRDARVNLVGFSYDTSLLPGEIEEYILVDTIRAYLEDELAAKIEEMVPPLLDEQLAGLALDTETEMLGREVSVSATFADAAIDDDGLAIGMDVDLTVAGDGKSTYAGWLYAGNARSHVSRDADLAMAVSDDFLNRALFEAWRAGVLDLSMSTDDGTLDPLMLLPLHATEGAITVDSRLPPVIVQADGGLQAQLAELVVTIDTPDGELGTHLEVSVAAFVNLDVEVEDGVLSIDLGDPTVSLTVRDSDWGASNEAVTRLVEEMLPLDTFMTLLGDIEFELPELAGLKVDKATAERDPSGVHTAIAVEIR